MSNYTIQTGVWVNHDSPVVLGATLTVSIRWGNYLIAALSSLVAFSGSRIWTIFTFCFHQRLATKQDKDVLHQQLQVHFRSGGSFFDSLVESIELHRAWKGRVGKVKRRTLTLALFSILFLLFFAAAGVFVAEVATQSYQDVLVLAAANDCGDLIFQDSQANNNEYLDTITDYVSDAAFWARNYARDAYGFDGSQPRESSFSRPTLPITSFETPCPYSNGTTCLGVNETEGPAWRMQTGPLNSHIHFGINAPAQDRVTFSKDVTCAVINATTLTTKPYSRIDNVQGHQINTTYIGILQQYAEDIGGDSNLAFEIDANLIYERVGFYIQRALYPMGQNDPDKDMTAPPFLRTDADVFLSVVTQSQMFYYAPVDDPLFLAHEATTGDEYAYDLSDTVYYPSIPFGLLACSEQMQICEPNTGVCTEPNGFVGMSYQLGNNTIELNNFQLATALRILGVLNSAGGDELGNFAARGCQGLLVADTRGVRGGGSMPPTQWRTEIELWLASNLANIQNGLLQWIAKPWPQGHPETLYPLVNMTGLDAAYVERGIGDAKNYLCQNQLIRSTAAVQNFSVLALVLVIFICSSIIITASVLPIAITWNHKRRKNSGRDLSRAAEAGDIARMADGKYNLLAMALQNAGVGEWEKGKVDIPVTKKKASVCSPVEKDGLAVYPCTSCDLCKVQSISTDTIEECSEKCCGEEKLDVEANDEGEKKAADGNDVTQDNDMIQKLRRSTTEQTLVASPINMEDQNNPALGSEKI